MARLPGRAASTVSREPGRNKGKRGHRPRQANEKAKERAHREGPGKWDEQMRREVEAGPGKGWTPEIISRRARKNGQRFVCRETSHKKIHEEARRGGTRWKHLPREVQRESSRLLQRAGVRRTLTLDNGKEFAWHQRIARENQVEVYVARPCHSWERGRNENLNGLIRRLLSERRFVRGVRAAGEEGLARLETWLNTRPRRCLAWQTPQEEMAVLLDQAAPAAA
jgi:IS30 family transposase